jgi:hypothetical protein
MTIASAPIMRAAIDELRAIYRSLIASSLRFR